MIFFAFFLSSSSDRKKVNDCSCKENERTLLTSFFLKLLRLT